MSQLRGYKKSILHDRIFVDTECSKGYVLVPGDIPGWGQIQGRIKTDAKGCAELCNDNKDCCSYEYSPRKKRCNLNRDCKPTRKKFKDFNFCAKGKEHSEGLH